MWELIACLCGETVAVQQRDAVAAEAHQATVGEFAEDFGGCLPGGADEGLAALTKTGDGAGTETYIHDANNNVINQTIKGTTTTFNYDRNRLLTASAGGTTSSYNYDPFGRLDTVTAAGTVLERNVYDGFDHVIENRKNNGSTTSTTKYTYDPLYRITTKTTDAGGAKEKTTTFNYNGLGAKLVGELHAPSMARGQHIGLTVVAAFPDRSDGVDDVLNRRVEVERGGRHRVALVAGANGAPGLCQARSGGAVGSAIRTTAAKQRFVSSGNDDVYVLPR